MLRFNSTNLMLITNYYLNLYERLSQVYLHQYCIFIALMIIKIYMFKRLIINDLNSLMDYSNEICDALNSTSSVLSTFPSSISNLINTLVISNLNQLQYSWLTILGIIISIIKNLLIFYIEIFLGTFTCLLTAAVSGTVDFALDSSETIIVAVNDTIVSVANEIEDGLDSLSTVINKVISTASSVENFFTGSDDDDTKTYFNKINLSISALKSVSIPSSVLKDIESFKSDIPNFDSLENSTSELIAEPLNFIGDELTKSSYFSKNVTIDHLPTFDDFATIKFCDNSEEIDDTIKELAALVAETSKIIMICLSLLIVLTLLSVCFIEFRKWKRTLNLYNELQASDNCGNILSNHSNIFLYFLSKRLRYMAPLAKNNLFWMINYITSPYAITIAMLSLIGFLTVLLQYVIVVQLNTNEISNSTTNDFKDLFENSSISYIKEVNSYLKDREDSLNEELFGYIKNTSTSINSTINDFLTNVNDSVVSVFASTPFESPISTIIYCVIGRKLIKIEEGLTWINDNLDISIPALSDSVIADNVEISNSTTDISNIIEGKLNSLISFYKRSLWFEFEICLGLFSLWLAQGLIGIIIICIKYYCIPEEKTARRAFSTSDIGNPQPLSLEAQQAYTYPYTDIHSKESLVSSSSVYDDTPLNEKEL